MGLELARPIELNRREASNHRDLVLKKRLPNGKWAPNYEGPSVVKQAFSGGVVVLTDSEGQELTHPVNVDAVKMFYP
ncbi:hypothetical protein CR513_28630, partial [Mucuna pruriens]